MGVDFSADFYNTAHVNTYGAEKYTSFLAEYILENYNLADHRGEAGYETWDEMYVIYTGDRQMEKKEITLSEEYFAGRKTSIDAAVKVVTYDGGNDILDQYITFCKIFNEQSALYPAARPLEKVFQTQSSS